MDVASSIARRTRSRVDSYYRNLLHDMNKIKPPRSSPDNANVCTVNIEDETDQESETDFIVDDDDVDDVDSDGYASKAKEKCKSVPRKGGRFVKKRARGVEYTDFAKLLEEAEDLVRKISPVFDDVREAALPPFKFKSGEDANSKKRARGVNGRLPDFDFARETALPLKFKFEEDDNKSSQKSEREMEIDRLFHDLELGIWESEVAPTDSCVSDIDDECSSQTDVDDTPAARCSRGEHDEFLDEQIGIVCTCCHTLILDIKYVLPPFCVESPERSEWRSMDEFKNDDQIQFKGSIYSNLESSNPCTGTVFDMIPKSDEELYPHQLEGFEFMWRNIAGDINIKNLKELPSKGGQGCIISHAPGTGKTRLTIVFLQTFLRLYPRCRPVIIAPRGMLLTWEQELKKWKAGINFHNLNETKLSDEENAVAAGVSDEGMGYHKSTDFSRFIKLRSWMNGGSILGVGYRLFEELAVEHKKEQGRCNEFKKILLESPGLLVLDEGHTPRNNQSLMWKVLNEVATQRRIILSGTPFQNNFEELYNTLSLVNPQFSHQIMSASNSSLGKASRKRGGRRKSDAAREAWTELTESIGTSTRNDEGVKKLRAMIQPFVHIHKGSILQKNLPGMRDCLIILRPTPLQQKLLEQNSANFLEQDYLASLISVHPSLVAENSAFTKHKPKLKRLQSDPNAGVKTHFLINLIHLSSRIKEKVLIFGAFLQPLLHVKELLKSHFGWNEGREVMYIDGELNMKQRQSLITSFNDRDSEAKVMLASQKACCEGISLVGASRVVLLDVSWNPSVKRQAICRAYRLGQEKMVYVYNLVTSMEGKKYATQTEKDRISELIFSAGGNKAKERGPCNEAVSEDKVLEAMVDHQGAATMFERIIHQPDDHLVKDFGFLDF